MDFFEKGEVVTHFHMQKIGKPFKSLRDQKQPGRVARKHHGCPIPSFYPKVGMSKLIEKSMKLKPQKL